MLKEYLNISELAGPLMMVEEVQDAQYQELVSKLNLVTQAQKVRMAGAGNTHLIQANDVVVTSELRTQLLNVPTAICTVSTTILPSET